jgi:hypothetical protein
MLNFQTFQFNKKSSGLFTPTYLDETGAVIAPANITSVTYTISDQNGQIINGRNNVSITPPAGIILLAADTDLISSDSSNAGGVGLRILCIKVLYNSATLGNNTPINMEFGFMINPLVNVAT